jgi:hypothetical protein
MATATDSRASEPVGSPETAGTTSAAARVPSPGDHGTALRSNPPTEAEAAVRERLEIIWRTITRDVVHFEGEVAVASVNSKRWNRIDRTLEELAAMLVDEVAEHERDSLTAATWDIWRYIEARLVDWAAGIEAARAAARQARAS